MDETDIAAHTAIGPYETKAVEQPLVAALVRSIVDQPGADEVAPQHARVVDSLQAECLN